MQVNKERSIMNPGNNKSGEIPSRKGVHFRSTTDSSANMLAPKASPTPTRPVTSAARYLNGATRQESTVKGSGIGPKTCSASAPSIMNKSHKRPYRQHDNPSAGKTHVEMSEDKELAQKEKVLSSRLASEIKKTEFVKKELRKKSMRRFKEKLTAASRAVLTGLLLFVFIGILILFFYYRSITKYSDSSEKFYIKGFEYIDAADTSESNLKKIEARKTGEEIPSLDLGEHIIVRNSVAYIPFSAVKDYFGLSVAGNNNSRSLTAGSPTSEYTGYNTAHFNFDSNEIRVNGSIQVLQGTSFMADNEFYFPYEFIESYVRGITINKSTDGKLTEILITKTSPKIYFGGSSNLSIDTPEYSDFISDSQSIHTYTIDVSSYEKYINPADRDKYLILVNNSNKLSEDYVPQELTNVKTNESRPVQQICFDASMALAAMLQAAEAAGYGDLAVNTGYRSYSYQSSLYNQKLSINMQKYDKSEAEKITSETVIFPGASDHQSGLAVDIHNLSAPMQTFATSREYKWLIEHCADFGFILRYPQSKEAVTGVKYEPWHFRFVGRDHAQKIMTQGLTLEEYLVSYIPENE